MKVNGYCEVLDADSTAIPNLYAAGDMILGGNLLTYYIGGRGTGTAFASGTITGTLVREALARVIENSSSD